MVSRSIPSTPVQFNSGPSSEMHFNSAQPRSIISQLQSSLVHSSAVQSSAIRKSSAQPRPVPSSLEQPNAVESSAMQSCPVKLGTTWCVAVPSSRVKCHSEKPTFKSNLYVVQSSLVLSCHTNTMKRSTYTVVDSSF